MLCGFEASTTAVRLCYRLDKEMMPWLTAQQGIFASRRDMEDIASLRLLRRQHGKTGVGTPSPFHCGFRVNP